MKQKTKSLAEATTPENVMMICPNLKCRKVLKVPGQFRGQHVKCHYCQITFEVPAKTGITSPAGPPTPKK